MMLVQWRRKRKLLDKGAWWYKGKEGGAVRRGVA